MNIGKSIKVAMAKKGMRGKELAEKLGVTPSSVSIMSSRKTASSTMLNKLCEAFDMPASDFVKLGED